MTSIEPPWPLNELARIDKLKGYCILDTPADPIFDRLTQLGARHLGVPTALISLVDEGRQWFKSRCGFDVSFTARRLSFCAYTILEDKVMVVPDTADDERFADNDLVTGPPNIRFYAGAPLKTPEGLLLGTFCVIDWIPRHDFGDQARRDLEAFAGIAMHELEMRAAQRAETAAKQDAQHAETRLRAIVDTAVDAMVVIDEGGTIQSLNPAAQRMFGYQPQEALGRNVRLLVPEPHRSNHDGYIARYLRTGERRIIGIGREVEGLRKDGSTFPLELSIAEWSVDGKRHFTGIMRDVSQRKEAERALRMREERFRSLVESAPQLMWLNGPDGSLEFFNAAWRTYTGNETNEETRWNDIHPDDRPRIQDIRSRAIAAGEPYEGEPYEYEMRLRRADGAYRWHLGRVNPLKEEGRIVAWIGTAMDVHDIRLAQTGAEEANRSKSRFLAAASHDLRQPLQSILLFAEALRAHVPDPQGRTKLGHLQQGLDTLKGLLDSLLDVSRLDAGIVLPQIEEFPVSEIFQQLGAAYAPVAEGKGVAWQVTPCTATVRSDRILLARMLRNLVENAIRYTERGQVVLRCAVHGERLHIEVCDSGIGIAPDQLKRVFEEFHQVGNPERDRQQGLGLGLAIVRRLSTLLNHPVQVHSRLGGGSVFDVAVPLAASGTASARPVPASSPVRMLTGGGRFAVVVDDDAIVLMALQTILQEWGYDVLTAFSTDQATDRLRAAGRRPDIVLVDYRLREERVGTEAVVRIRDMFGADVPGVILTGEIGPEPQRDAAAHGLGLIHKPVTPRLLEAALSKHVQPPELIGPGIGGHPG